MGTEPSRSANPPSARKRPTRAIGRRTRAAAFRYDAFISYSPDDADWVESWLLPRLEGAGLVICTPQTGFAPGAPLLGETERAIRESRRILAVLTPEWVDGDWSAFEAALAHHQDPNAHTRRLIPLLLRPCDPPERIQLLHWVDLTEEAGRDADVDRIIQALRGEIVLPELDLDPFPEPQLWLAQTWWFKVVGLLALMTFLLVAAYVAWPRLPPGLRCALRPGARMPASANSFNVAVAAFGAEADPAGGSREEAAQQGLVRARDVANLVRSLSPEISAIVRKPVTVWGPDECVGAVALDQAADRLGDLDAQVLVYGTVRHVAGTEWKLSPLFALKNEVVQLAPDLAGEHRLGRAVAYDAADEDDVGSVLADRITARAKAVVRLLRGLVFYAKRDQDGYAQAVAIFQEAADDPAWGSARENSGQEVLYLFLGDALMKQAIFAEGDATARIGLLERARGAFDTAILRDARYGRAWNGRGAALFQMARPTAPVDRVGTGDAEPAIDNVCAWDWALLAAAREAYLRALDPSTEKPAMGFVDLRASLGLGLVAFWEGRCPESGQNANGRWEEATRHLDSVIADYEAIGQSQPAASQSPGDRLDPANARSGDDPAPPSRDSGGDQICRRPFAAIGESASGEGGASGGASEPADVERARDLVRLEVSAAHTHLGNMALLRADRLLGADPAASGAATPLFAEAAQDYSAAVEASLRFKSDDGDTHVGNVMPFLLTAYCLAGQPDCAAAVLGDFAEASENPVAAKDRVLARMAPDVRKECFP